MENKTEYKLIHGDCLEEMKKIPDGSVDLVLTDPPYNIKKASWDNWAKRGKENGYLLWSINWIKEAERVLKSNGSMYIFHNDIPQIAELVHIIRKKTKLIFNSFIVWDKGDFRALSWKNPSEKNNLRSWFNTCEYILYYTFQDDTGLSNVMLDVNNFPTLRAYFRDYLKALGVTKKTLIEKIGQSADHCFRWNSSQWDLPTASTYIAISYLPLVAPFVRREYEDLRREYEDLRFVHNLDANHNNVWKSFERNNGKLHPTQKPLDLMSRLIITSTNQCATILDPFMGSGTTGVACKKLNRNFTGIELDKEYFEIAKKRIEQSNL